MFRDLYRLQKRNVSVRLTAFFLNLFDVTEKVLCTERVNFSEDKNVPTCVRAHPGWPTLLITVAELLLFTEDRQEVIVLNF